MEVDGTTPAPATLDTFEERARKLGEEHGKNAASWYFDGNTDEETYRSVLQGLEDGDPEIMETLPGSPLSGEWADGMTMGDLLSQVGVDDPHAELSFNPEPWDSIADAYCDAYGTAAMHEVERVARLQLRACFCPDDCGCHHPWRANVCGCRAHEVSA